VHKRDLLNSMFIVVIISTAFFPWSADGGESYSPPANQQYPDKLLWGDTHLHTYLSGDAYTLGTLTTPDQAYRFAKGESIKATGGDMVRLRRPLDFMMVADHAENLGAMPAVAAGNQELLATPDGEEISLILKNVPALPSVIHAGNKEQFLERATLLNRAKAGWSGNYELSSEFKQSIWYRVIDAAEKHNDPGNFTTFAGYEWSSNPPMLHRNVVFLNGPEITRQTVPFSKYDSYDVEDLWRNLDDYMKATGGEVIAIPHNSNLSGGGMFSPLTYQGKPIANAYAKTRSRIEPIVEVTQIKGDSEAHPYISPEDEFADFETYGAKTPPATAKPDAKGKVGKADKMTKGKGKGKGEGKSKADKVQADKQAPNNNAKAKGKGVASADPMQIGPGSNRISQPADFGDTARQSYVRPALQAGLAHERRLGTNPFKLGMIGATDSHTGLAAVTEDNFWGKMGSNEPGPYRAGIMAYFSASGFAGVWATENTRDAIFAAMKRREVYATSGPRISVRFFGGWNYTTTDAQRPNIADVGYRNGVPMGGDLASPVKGKSPTFLIRTTKDPDGANLDRVQVVKGWLDGKGKVHEKIYNVAWSDDRVPDVNGRLTPVGSTVDTETATYTNSIGDTEFSVAWSDPAFDAADPAFYYIRVLQIPTPRWTGYDKVRYGITDLPDTTPLVLQDRAYSSPIWYTP
jgi:hypothetical protein